jgi:hypothetical protein
VWLVVTGPRGAALRAMPDVDADSWGYAPKGQTMKKLGRLERGSFGSDEKDYLYVENLGPGGHKGNAWVFEAEVAPTSGPAFQSAQDVPAEAGTHGDAIGRSS